MKKYLVFLIALSFSSNVMAAYLLEEAALGARRVAHLWKAPVSLTTLTTIPRTSSALLSRSFFSGVSVHDFTLMRKPVSTFPVFSFRGFSSSASVAFEPETAKLQVKLWQREIELGTSENDKMNQKSKIFSKAISEKRMYKDQTQAVLSLESTLKEAGTCVEKNCYKTLKKLGLRYLSEAAEELSNVAKSVLTELKIKGNIDSLFYDRPFSDNFSQVSYRWSLALEKEKNDIALTKEQIDQVLIAVHNVYVLRQKLSEIL